MKTEQEVLNAGETRDDFLLKVADTTRDSFSCYSSQAIKRLAEDVGKSGFGRFSEHTWFYGKGTEDVYNEAFDCGLL